MYPTKRNMIDVEELFGPDKAEEDNNLARYFIHSNQYESIVKGSKNLILGRKGSGKSALYCYLNKQLEKEGNICIGICPSGEDFVKINDLINSIDGIALKNDFKYSMAWEDLILSEIALRIIDSFENDVAKSKVKQYLIQNGTEKPGFYNRFAKSLLSVIKGAKVKTSVVDIDLNFENISTLNPIEQREIKELLTKFITTKSIYVLFDHLDEAWENSEEMNSCLRGLIQCNRKLKSRYSTLKLITFLRDDIYDEMAKKSDLFDVHNSILTLDWKDDRNYSLRRLIAARIATYFSDPIPEQITEFDFYWKLIFPENVEYTNPYGKTCMYSTQYIIERTFSRPREFLQYCQLILEKAQSNTLPVPFDTIISVESIYSDWKMTDIIGEFSSTYENIENCIYSFANVSANWRFDYAKIAKHIESLPETELIYDCIKKVFVKDDDLIKLLYRIGFLRKVTKVSKTPKYITSGMEKHINPKMCNFDIHPAFRKKLISV